jgi:hypothetical protein
MKLKPEFILIFLLCSCIYDPPRKGKDVSIHNQTNRPIMVLDSLTEKYFKLYDTAKVNDRRYISRQPAYITEYGVYRRFYSDAEIENLKNKNINRIALYVIDYNNLGNTPGSILINHLYRSFDISIDTLKKYELNHLFISTDTMLLEHDYNYYTNWKQ